MPRHLISDAHEWINEIPTVPIYYLAKPQPRERAWNNQRGKKTLLSLTLVRLCEMTNEVQPRWEISSLQNHYSFCHFTYSVMKGLPLGCSSIKSGFRSARPLRKTWSVGEFGWGGTSVKLQHRCPTVSSKRTEISCRPKGEKLT